MITIAKLSQQVIRIISGGDQSKDSQLDKREVNIAVGQAINQLATEGISASIQLGNKQMPSHYIATYRDITVKKDTDLGVSYIDIPSAYLLLTEDRGIQQVSSMKNQADAFIITRSGHQAMFGKVHAGKLEMNTACYAERFKLFFNSDISKKGIDKVLLKIVIGNPEDLSETAPLPIDPAMEAEVVKMVLALFGQPIQQDKINDNEKLPINARTE